VKVSFFNERADEPAAAEARPRLFVPKAAVRTDGGQTIVFLVREERVERRAVKVGAADGDEVEVLSGLSAGERVVVEGPDTLADGARVKER
jgi:multidrug efflux pump subunit AcrA (membrane-fusion protein)